MKYIYPHPSGIDDFYFIWFSAPNHYEWLITYDLLLNFSKSFFTMKDFELSNFETFRKAQRCATLYELLCEALNLEPLSPKTTWQDVAKSYSITMEEAFKLQKSTENETVKD